MAAVSCHGGFRLSVPHIENPALPAWGQDGASGMEGERSFPEKGESLFFIGLARGALDLIASRVDRGLDGFDVQRLVCDDDRFAPGVRRGDLLTGTALRMVSLMCDSHMPHIMPSIFSVVLYIRKTSHS